MDIHGIILIVIAIVEFIFGLFLFITREKGHIIYSYSLTILGIVFWVLSNGLYRLVNTSDEALFWVNIAHLSAGFIAMCASK